MRRGSDLTADSPSQRDAIAEVRREFAGGLPDRVAVMRTALAGLSRGFDKALADTFFLKTHALKGTAAAFGAHEVSAIAAELTERARRWVKEESLLPAELAEAQPELERLAAAIDQYRERVARGEEA